MLWFPNRNPGRCVYNDEDTGGNYVLDRDESVSLTETYVNEDEGFSFMYPHGWDIEDVEGTNPYALVSIVCTDMSGTYARIAVAKEIDDGYYFAATESDFEELYSYEEGLSDVKVLELSDIALDGYPARKLTLEADNNKGVRCILIHYFYSLDSYVYTVVYVIVEDRYNEYEPKFDAIMDSYTIAARDTTIESGISDNSNKGEILYDGISVSDFFVLSADELVEILGTPIDYNEYTLIYDDIEFWLDNGKIASAESFAAEKFTIDGVTLDKGQNELKELLGDPSNEGDGGSGYQLEFSLEDCEIVIAVDEGMAWRIWLYPPRYQTSQYLTGDNLMENASVVCSWNEAAEVVYRWLDSHPLGYETKLSYSDREIIDEAYPIQLMIEDDYTGESFIGTIFVSATDGSMIITVPAMDDTGEWTKSYDFSIDQWYSEVWMSVGDV